MIQGNRPQRDATVESHIPQSAKDGVYGFKAGFIDQLLNPVTSFTPTLTSTQSTVRQGNQTMVTDVRCSNDPLSLMFSNQMNPKPTEPRSERSSEPRRKDQTVTASVHRAQVAKRRSSRMALNAPVGLSGEDRQKSSFTMPAKATKLNKHGAAVQLNRELLVGSTVVVRNKNGNQVSARVVAQLAALQGIPTYAIEFAEQDDSVETFWGITFPPVESRGASAQAEEQSGVMRRRRGPVSLQD